MNEQLIEKLKKLAASKCLYDDEDEFACVNDYAAGNVDDAFAVGEQAGVVMLAREILESLNVSY